MNFKKNSGFWRQVICTCIVYSSYGLIGISRGYVPFLLVQLKNSSDWVITENVESWIASLIIFPNPVGSVLIGFLMDIFGRRLSLNISMACFTIGWAVIASATTVWQIYIGNVILGIATGMSLCTSVYVAEICEQHLRCTMLSLFVILYAAGTCVAYVLTGFLSWKLSAVIFLTISLLGSVCTFFILESPYWLLKKGRNESAKSTLRKLRDDDELAIEAECQDILYSLTNNRKKKEQQRWLKTFLKHWKPFAILIIFQMCLQGSGYNILLTYSTKLFPKFTRTIDTKSLAVGYSCMILLSALLSPFVIQFCNRRSVMKISSGGMTFGLSLLVVYMLCDRLHSGSLALAEWMVPVSLYIYAFACIAGAVTISESMAGELFPTEVRGIMCGTLQACGTTMAALLVKMYPIVESYISTTAIVASFTCFSFFMMLFSIFILPETRGKNLEQIQAEL